MSATPVVRDAEPGRDTCRNRFTGFPYRRFFLPGIVRMLADGTRGGRLLPIVVERNPAAP